jgi:DNA polymerase I-like protein with 3'-5' exonuclease and polymerase domains
MAELPSWKGAKRVCVDVETKDEKLTTLGIGVRRGGHIVGYGFTIEDGPSHYLPVRHEGGDNLDPKQVARYLKAQAGAFTGEIAGAKLDYDLDYMAEEGIEFKKVKYFRDCLIADGLLNELQDNYDLESVCKRHDVAGKDETVLMEAAAAYCTKQERKMRNFHKKFLHRLPGRFAGQYCEQDTRAPLAALRKQEKLIDSLDLWNIYNLESQVTPVLVKMRRRGVRIDIKHLEEVERWSLAEETKALSIVKHETGLTIGVGNVWKPDALAQPLFAIGMQLKKTAKGEWNIDQDVLASVDHPVTKAIAQARKVNKLRTTFATSIRTYMTNGRIHCTFNQMRGQKDENDAEQGGQGGRYGRLSCVKPNLQQQPSRDDFADFWRKIYIPEEGALWDCNDYSQQEPRWTTHFAAVKKLPGAEEACAAYHADPNLDNHQFMADLTGLPRKYAKNIYLGLCYGEGGAKLCHDIGLPTRWALAVGKGRERRVQFFASQFEAYSAGREYADRYIYEAAGEEGQRVLDAFDSRAPFIKKLAKAASETAKKRGYIITIEGRHLHFPVNADGSYDWTHKALNRLIQGTSADQTKKAMVAIDAAGHFLQLQVHDDLNSSVSGITEANKIAFIMQDIIPAKVPFRVDVETGSSWGDLKKAA